MQVSGRMVVAHTIHQMFQTIASQQWFACDEAQLANGPIGREMPLSTDTGEGCHGAVARNEIETLTIDTDGAGFAFQRNGGGQRSTVPFHVAAFQQVVAWTIVGIGQCQTVVQVAHVGCAIAKLIRQLRTQPDALAKARRCVDVCGIESVGHISTSVSILSFQQIGSTPKCQRKNPDRLNIE
ncbi:hypothetical protein SDC9_159062 [bioreactor metagenome]|uniref:Uncharacterized protein n=1 Tax=bioreactor metagenome TaxID=1076179 RepID=A0A645FGZ4_9ZZZZ